MKLTAFGISPNLNHPKVVAVDGVLSIVPEGEALPGTYDYLLEPETKVVGEETLVYRTYNDGTVVLRAVEAFLSVESVVPADGGTIHYPTAGGAMATDIVVTFSEDVQADDLALVTLVENPATTPVTLAGVTTVVGSVFTIAGAVIATGQTGLVLNIPVGAFSGVTGNNVLADPISVTFVATGV